MSFSDHKIQTFTHKISDLPDQPNMQPEELKAHFDSSPEELRQALNALCDALAAQTAAADIGFAQTAGVPETTVQEAIENVQSQVTEAIIGSIPSGSITGDKLAQDVRDRFSAIESAATTEVNNRTSADSNLQSQISALSTTKCEVYIGSYTGNGQPQQEINLGFYPQAVLVLCANYDMERRFLHCLANRSVSVYDYTDTSKLALRITQTGFTVYERGSDINYITAPDLNNVSYVYNYIAFK